METLPPVLTTLLFYLPVLGWLPKSRHPSVRANSLEFLSLERLPLSLGLLQELHSFLTAVPGSRKPPTWRVPGILEGAHYHPFGKWMDSGWGILDLVVSETTVSQILEYLK